MQCASVNINGVRVCLYVVIQALVTVQNCVNAYKYPVSELEQVTSNNVIYFPFTSW